MNESDPERIDRRLSKKGTIPVEEFLEMLEKLHHWVEISVKVYGDWTISFTMEFVEYEFYYDKNDCRIRIYSDLSYTLEGFSEKTEEILKERLRPYEYGSAW